MSSIFAGSFFKNGPFTSFSEIVYSVMMGSVLEDGQLFPELWRQRLVRGQPVRFRIGPQSFLRVFAKLAVDFSGRKSRAVEQDLDLCDRRIDLALEPGLAR